MTPEWSYKIDAEEISATPKALTITASEQERADLARRLRIVAIGSLSTRLTLRREAGHVIHVDGTLQAQVTQSCVVTDEPVPQTIETPVEGWFSAQEEVISLTRARRDRMAGGADAELPVLEERDDPEPLEDGRIDLGELAAQTLSLALDPYPHAPGAVSARMDDPEQAVLAQKRPNPFAALKDWKADTGRGK